MPYPKIFHRLVLFGTLYGDTWNTSLSIVPSGLGEIVMPEPTDQFLADVAADVGPGWFGKATAQGGSNTIGSAYLLGIKLNRIGPDGKYADNSAHTYTYGAPLGGEGGAAVVAPQLTTVATLRTAIERGPGSKGRMYLPPVAWIPALGPDGRLTNAQATAIATTTKNLIVLLNTRYGSGRVGVASNVGSGRFEHVTRVTVGRVVDTMRTRRNKQREEPQAVAIPA
jgi:hypothetical protein